MDHNVSTQEPVAQSTVEQILTFLQSLLRPPMDEQPPVIGHPSRGRPAILSSDHLWLAMLVAMLRAWTGFACVWRLITWEGIGTFPVLNMTRDGIRKRLLHANMKALQELLTRVSAALLTWTRAYQYQNLAPFATEVFALDQTTLDAVRRQCQDVREEEKGSPRLMVGKLLGFFDIRRQQWRRILFRDDVFVNEKHLEGRALDALARCADSQGDTKATRRNWEAALTIFEKAGVPEADELRLTLSNYGDNSTA
jgi:hypothetical protein